MAEAEAQQYFRGAELTARFGVTNQTLRNWEREHKIPPAGRTAGGHRRYTLLHVQAIQQMLASGVSGNSNVV